MTLPIDRGIFPVILGILAFGSLLAGAGLHPRRWLLWLGSMGVTTAAVMAVGKVFGIEHRVGSTFPPSFYVWAALPLGCVLAGGLSWRELRRVALARWAAPVVLLGLFGAVEVNSHYAYLPTVGDVMGVPMRDQVSGKVARSIVAPGPWRSPEHMAVHHHGVLVRTEIPSTASGFKARPGYVWLPPAYFDERHPRLPVIVLVAGVPGDPSNLLRAGATHTVIDQFAAAHHGVAPILVFPDHNGGLLNDTECVDGPRGRAETYLTSDLPAFVTTHFGAALQRRPWAIVGYSEGGTCALTLSLRHPALFGRFIDIGGELRPSTTATAGPRRLAVARLYGGRANQWRAHDPWRLLATRPKVSGVFVTGSLDRGPAMVARELHARATRFGVRTKLVTVPGGHSFDMVRKAIAATLPRLAGAMLGPDVAPTRPRLADAAAPRRLGMPPPLGPRSGERPSAAQ